MPRSCVLLIDDSRTAQAWQEAVDLLRQVWQDPHRHGAVVSVLKVLRPP